MTVAEDYCQACDRSGHCEHDHKEIRTALFDYMACLQLEDQFEGGEDETVY